MKSGGYSAQDPRSNRSSPPPPPPFLDREAAWRREEPGGGYPDANPGAGVVEEIRASDSGFRDSVGGLGVLNVFKRFGVWGRMEALKAQCIRQLA